MSAAAPGSLARDLCALPNVITLGRLLLLVAAVGLYALGLPAPAIVLGVVAGVTDYLDGAMARATGHTTWLGDVLDKFADLVFESVCLFMGVIVWRVLPAAALLMFLLREFWVQAIRTFMAGRGTPIPSSLVGKLGANVLMWGFLPMALGASGLVSEIAATLAMVARVLVATGIVLGYVSGAQYTRRLLAASHG